MTDGISAEEAVRALLDAFNAADLERCGRCSPTTCAPTSRTASAAWTRSVELRDTSTGSRQWTFRALSSRSRLPNS